MTQFFLNKETILDAIELVLPDRVFDLTQHTDRNLINQIMFLWQENSKITKLNFLLGPLGPYSTEISLALYSDVHVDGHWYRSRAKQLNVEDFVPVADALKELIDLSKELNISCEDWINTLSFVRAMDIKKENPEATRSFLLDRNVGLETIERAEGISLMWKMGE